MPRTSVICTTNATHFIHQFKKLKEKIFFHDLDYIDIHFFSLICISSKVKEFIHTSVMSQKAEMATVVLPEGVYLPSLGDISTG